MFLFFRKLMKNNQFNIEKKLFLSIFICLFVLTPATANEIVQLTDEADSIILPYWSSDGERIVYLSWNVHDTESDMELWIMDADGSDKIQLLNENDVCGFTSGNPLSPDGSRLLYISNVTGNRELWIAETDSMEKRQLTESAHLENYFPTFEKWKASWSPDGSQIVYVSGVTENSNLWKLVETSDGEEVLMFDISNLSKDYDIWVIDSDGANNIRLTDDGKQNMKPEWHPSGENIAFGSNITGNGGIWIMNKDGSEKTQLVDGATYHATWSPDGTKISYVEMDRENYASYLWVMDANGDNKILLNNYSGHFTYHSYPKWSPNSTKIVYVKDDRENYTSSIWVMNIDGSEQTKIGDGIAPQWSPKGDRIAFTELNGDRFTISVIILDEELAFAPAINVASVPDTAQENTEKTPGFGASITVLILFLLCNNMKKRD